MSIGVSLGGRKLNGKEESELGEARTLREKGRDGLGRVNEFWHGGEWMNVCVDVLALSNDRSSRSGTPV